MYIYVSIGTGVCNYVWDRWISVNEKQSKGRQAKSDPCVLDCGSLFFNISVHSILYFITYYLSVTQTRT